MNFNATSRMSLGFIFLTALGAFPGPSRASHSATASTPSHAWKCDDAEVRIIRRPFYTGANNRVRTTQKFRYRFRFIPPAPGKPVLVVLPGGPGGTSMTFARDFPEGFGVIFTDPRGVGCNRPVYAEHPHLPDEFYTSENLARDALAAIASVHADSYILYGSSYGTIVATIAAGIAEKEDLPRPLAVVVTGILGKAFENGAVFRGFTDVWTKILQGTRVPPEVQAELRKGRRLEFSSAAWGRLIEVLLVFGPSPQGDALAVLSGILPTASSELRESLTEMLKSLESVDADPATQKLYRAIACHEISGGLFSSSMDVDFKLEGTRLLPVPHDLCAGISVDRAFDAARWPTKSPIYAFEGEADPSTPMDQALHHFASQPSADRFFVTTADGGHSVLDLGLTDCQSAIFRAIAEGGETLAAALGSCALRSRIERRSAGH